MKILTALLTALLLTTAVAPRPAHAVVGLLVKSSTTRSVGGIVAAGGLTFALGGRFATADGWVALGLVLSGLAVAGIGLIVLDENQTAEARFVTLRSLQNFSAADVATYNSELDELNAIHQTVVAELNANPRLNETALWRGYADQISPATLMIAAQTGKRLLESLH